ncbi:ParB/RepB/Spo0J family partition protein [Streptomyces sp. NPDC050658]|uniref:ParB/RepB/Spo0J family partition protein n=1 Tax=unclassified Streptomyces TaxID=2593676 RepID=UPI003415396E
MSKSKKDAVPRYESEQPAEDAPTRNAILDHYGLGAAPTDVVDDTEREMLAWEEAQQAKLAAEEEDRQALRAGTRLHPSKVALSSLAHNPYNPRETLAKLAETTSSLKERGQLNPVVVVTRSAFLKAHPGQDAALGEAVYVVIDGNRRLAAAAPAGLDSLRIHVNDDLAATAADILESALIANIHREDVAPLDQAKAIQELVSVHGSQGKVAKRLSKTPAWVSQRLALLGLTTELQEQVENGDLKVEHGRRIGRLPKKKQAAEAQKIGTKTPRPRKPKDGEKANAPTVNGVNTPATDSGSEAPTAPTVNGVNTPSDLPLPWDNPLWFDLQLRKHMSDENRQRLVWLLQGSSED